MKKCIYTSLFCLVFCFSCTSTYYLANTDSETSVYYSKTVKGKKLITIPKGKEVVVKGKSKYIKIKYNDTIGWVYKPSLVNIRDYNYKGPFKVSKRKKKSYSSSSGSGTVYVRGYYRKDGTYVRPHTRRKSK